MDTSKKYILMCEKAEEIRKHWRRRVGDFYCGYKNIMIATGAGREDDGTISYSNTIYTKANHAITGRIIWLPRQDQLQEMIPLKSKFHRVVDKLYDFTEWVKVNATYVTSDCSMEQLWLAFVMKEKYKKTWNGKEWVKCI